MRESYLRALIPAGLAFVADQIPTQIRPWAPRGPFFVNGGGTQLQEIDQCRPQLLTAEGEPRNAFDEPLPPREQIARLFGLAETERDLVPDIAAPYVEPAAA